MTAEDNLSELRKEHLERVRETYNAKSKEFQRVFNGLVIFAILFFFLILLPYISLQIENRRVSSDLNSLLEEIKPIEERYTAYKQAQEGIQELQSYFQEGPEELKEYIKILDAQCAEGGGFTQQSGCPTDKAEKDAWLNQGVQEKVQEQFASYQEIMAERVIAPLQSIDGGSGSIELTTLAGNLNSLQNVFEKKLAENPGFWKKFEFKVKFYAQLDLALDGVWGQYQALLQAEGGKLESELTVLEGQKTQFEERQSRLKIHEETIVERLNQIEFPFGKIPLGLNESIAVFPLLLSVGFIVYTSLLCDMMRARQAFHRFYQQKDPGQKILTDDQVSLVAPLPIEPLDRGKNLWLQFVVLSIPFAIFIVACGLNLFSWTIPQASSDGTLYMWIDGGLYILCLGLFAYGYRHVSVEIHRYRESDTRIHSDINRRH